MGFAVILANFLLLFLVFFHTSWILLIIYLTLFFFFFKQKTAYEMRISDWSSDVCSSDLVAVSIAVASGCSPLEIVDGRGGILVHAKAVEVEDTQGVQPLPMAGKGRPLCEVHGFGEVALDADAVYVQQRQLGLCLRLALLGSKAEQSRSLRIALFDAEAVGMRSEKPPS